MIAYLKVLVLAIKGIKTWSGPLTHRIAYLGYNLLKFCMNILPFPASQRIGQ